MQEYLTAYASLKKVCLLPRERDSSLFKKELQVANEARSWGRSLWPIGPTSLVSHWSATSTHWRRGHGHCIKTTWSKEGNANLMPHGWISKYHTVGNLERFLNWWFGARGEIVKLNSANIN